MSAGDAYGCRCPSFSVRDMSAGDTAVSAAVLEAASAAVTAEASDTAAVTAEEVSPAEAAAGDKIASTL